MSDDDFGSQPFAAGAVSIVRATERAILVESLRGKGEARWVPQSAVHDDSEVWKQGDEGKLVVKTWFADREGWLGGKRQAELPGTSQAKCRKCQAPIVWVKTAAGKNTPNNLDGAPHWATCPSANEFRR